MATDRPRRPHRAGLLAATALLTVSAVSLAGLTANADPLTEQRAKVQQQLAQQRSDLNESTHDLNSAVVAVESARTRLATAQAQLAQTRREVAAAQQRDRVMAAKLEAAQAALAKAKAAVVEGQRQLDAEYVLVGQVARDQYQQQNNLLPLAMLTTSTTMAEFQTRLQWSTTMFDTTQATIDRLTVLQRRLSAKKAAWTALETSVAANRKKAAADLVLTKALEAKAAQQAASVAALLDDRQQAEKAASAQVASDKTQYAALQAERVGVDRRIAARIAQQKVQAKAQAEAEARRQAREAARRSSGGGSSSGGSSSGGTSSGGTSSGGSTSGGSGGGSASSGSAHHGFLYPVSAPITSPYGMRLHPVLGYWKLHDGTDFGAGCGTPIRAAYSGTVTERYFNAGYGNRLMIEHGRVDGSYVTTGYNHAISYTVGVGQHVSQGQTIGYVGTTGYSTGCHLHLMLWQNGSMVNPMSWY